jgi:hypothetical protein
MFFWIFGFHIPAAHAENVASAACCVDFGARACHVFSVGGAAQRRLAAGAVESGII